MEAYLVMAIIAAGIGYFIFKGRLSEKILDSPGPGGTRIPEELVNGEFGEDPLTALMLMNLLKAGYIDRFKVQNYRQLSAEELTLQMVNDGIMTQEQADQFAAQQREIMVRLSTCQSVG
ncbi:hypothetical protein GJ688_03920 [Heliobacillus mobilis]|uniref:Uncharacterized protein n=1 Tax=Heliobacterium mobile TaxID=28064 RepID=A0A6I3SH07_HELMO|nr:hypothetical protein [Heliobacterium mobile]MTV48129.1 hypothetical protein [Heliobacterium mobile]